ncbi:hypothetical protein [Afipia clevelandensis]|uniref:Uncharacterized protein n=1 Tax=Afipia clevelandensis ATCC 49720 TaxID=883079 RepID=K8PL86_9BRAD|nr:hypothetical protein [Afipia clevelandensis]EGP08105.1 hypothetical protein CSIRO_2704 [Bradyrhizobiaceae bacterium SG-6C]EKS40255.1 hypothetical protein HMPREF9696_00706 [Afipia clevelandensis ATCC 49720]
MECPFCAEKVKDEALVCKHCSRDLRLVRPVLREIEGIVADLETIRREFDNVSARLYRRRHPVRSFALHSIAYILIPAILLVAAHVIITIVLNVSPLYLRIASVLIPLPFGVAIYAIQKVGWRGAIIVGVATALLSVLCMLTVTGLNDHVPILPASWIEWREVLEYSASIALAFLTGNILGILILRLVASSLSQGDKPNAAAYRVAKLLGPYVGDDELRRRARIIQDLIKTVGPLLGILSTAAGSIYAGLKGILGT